jgi:hypothetical protein
METVRHIVYAGLTYYILREMQSTAVQTNNAIAEFKKTNDLAADAQRAYIGFLGAGLRSESISVREGVFGIHPHCQ